MNATTPRETASDDLPSASRLRTLLGLLNEGDTAAYHEILPPIYDELKALAHAKLSAERIGHTLGATELVHEAYLRLQQRHRLDCRDQGHFFALVALNMRRVLVDHARKRRAQMRDRERQPLDDYIAAYEANSFDLVELDNLLDALEEHDRSLWIVFLLHHFDKLPKASIARVLGISVDRVSRQLDRAKIWLCHRLTPA